MKERKFIAKPFIKWAGGKGRLLDQIERKLPADFDEWKEVTYIKPFIGGGSMLFHMLQNHPNITHAVTNDINVNLINCYKAVKEVPEQLIEQLKEFEQKYLSLELKEQKQLFLSWRESYNNIRISDDIVKKSVLFIALNKTCFNGLYRVNSSGNFNTSFGKNLKPCICDAETIRRDSDLLQDVEIDCGDYEQTLEDIDARHKIFFYFDPPYRPLNKTSSFNHYDKGGFDDEEQKRLKRFCDKIDRKGFSFMLSNSDGKTNGGTDDFMDKLYSDYHIDRVSIGRCINSDPAKRGKITEILVRNYDNIKENKFKEIKLF